MKKINRSEKGFKDLALYFASRFAPAGLNFITILFLLEVVDKSEYARFSSWSAFLLFVGGLASGFLSQITLRYLPGDGLPRQVLASLWVRYFGVGVLFLFILGFAYPFFLDEQSILIASILGLIAIFSFNSFNSLSQAEFSPGLVALSSIIRSLIFLALILIFHYSGFAVSLEVLALFWFISYAGASLINVSNQKLINFNSLKWCVDRATHYKVLGFGIPITIWLGISGFQLGFVKWALMYVGEINYLSVYSPIFDVFFNLPGLIFSALLAWLHPILASLWNGNNAFQFYRLIKKVIALEFFSIVSLLVVIFFVKWAEVSIPLLEKPIQLIHEHLDAVFSMVLASWMWQLGMLLHKPGEFSGQLKIMFLLSAISSVLGVGFAAIAIYLGNYSWLPNSLVISNLAYCVICCLIFWRNPG